MDIRHKTDFEFINFSDLEESSKNEIKTILKSHTASDFLELPWDICENDVEYNEEHVEALEQPKEWHSYADANPGQIKYESIPAPNLLMPTMPSAPYSYVTQIAGDWSTATMFMPNMAGDINSYMSPIHYPQGLYATPAAADTQDLPMMRSESRRGRGRGGKRGDSFSNRNHSHNHNLVHNDIHSGYMPVEHNQYVPMVAQSIFPMPELNGTQQHPVAGQPIFSPNLYSYAYTPSSIHQQQIHPNYRQYVGNQKYPRSNPNPMMSPSNGEVYMKHQRVPKERQEKHFYPHHRGPNNRGRNFRQTEDDVNIVTTTTKVIVKNSQVEDRSTSDADDSKKASSNLPVNVKIEHTVDLSTLNNDAGEFVKENITEGSSSRVNINSSIEVKQNGDEKKEVKVEQVVSEPEVVQVESEPVSQKPVEEKVVEKIVEPVVVVEEKAKEEIKVVEEAVVLPVQTTPPPPPAVAAAPQTKISFANMVKKTNAVKPTAKVTPIHVNNVTASSQSDETEHEKMKQNTRAGVAPNNAKPVSPIVQKNGQPTNNENNNNNISHSISTNAASMQNQVYCHDPFTNRIGEFLINYQMDKQTVSLLPRGLTNRSNYCYINSILQALLACPPFYNLLKAMPYSKNVSKKNSVSPLLDNMMRFVREFTLLSDGARLLNRKDRSQKRSDNAPVDIQSDVPFEPVYVYTMLKNTSSVFSVEGRQEDAEEFLSCLLNGLSDEMLELMKIASNDTKEVQVEANLNHSQGEEEWKVMGPKNKGSITRCTEFGRTPLSDIFRGQLRSRVFRSGEQSTDYVQPFFTLQLDIEKAETVQDAFGILAGKDQVEGMTCSKTKQQIEAWKQVFLEELPVILILHLKWFDYKLDGCSKILKQVEFPINLKVDNKFLSQNAMKKFNIKQRQYKLFAVTYHDGKEATKGHYLTDAFHVGYGTWVRYDDNSLKSVFESSVLKPQPPRVPYLLYYRRQDTIGNNSNNSSNANNNNQTNNVRSR